MSLTYSSIISLGGDSRPTNRASANPIDNFVDVALKMIHYTKRCWFRFWVDKLNPFNFGTPPWCPTWLGLPAITDLPAPAPCSQVAQWNARSSTNTWPKQWVKGHYGFQWVVGMEKYPCSHLVPKIPKKFLNTCLFFFGSIWVWGGFFRNSTT